MECDKPHPKSSHPLKTVTFVAKYIFLYKFKIYTYLSSCFQENTYTDAALYCLGFHNHSRLETMRDFAWMLRRREDDLLNYFGAPIDNGIAEGLNNKAKVIIHKAYGFKTATNYTRICITAWLSCHYRKPCTHLRDEPFSFSQSVCFSKMASRASISLN
ncbi:MAG: transposase [Pseudomonadota bacterium]